MGILQARGISKAFGGLQAVDGVDFEVEPAEIVGIIGPNGSGKTTLCNCVMGLLRPDSGTVCFRGQDITGLPPYQISRLGLRKTFQLVHLFPNMTVFECLLLGQQETHLSGFSARLRPHSPDEVRIAMNMLEFLGLQGVRDHLTDSLSYGQQKLLEFGLALVASPTVVILDEPVAGVNPTMAVHLRDRILEARKRGTTFLIVEHEMAFVMGLCDRIVVLNQGRKICEGTPDQIRRNEEVVEVYLGV